MQIEMTLAVIENEDTLDTIEEVTEVVSSDSEDDFVSPSHPSFVARYEPLVKRIAFHLLKGLPKSVVADDLIGAGMIGLLEAAGKYDPEAGAKFETYAGIRVRGAMLDEVRRCDWTPRSVHRKSREITEKTQQLASCMDGKVTAQMVADELGLSVSEVYAVQNDATSSKVASLDELAEFGDVRVSDEGSSRLANIKNSMMIQPEDGVEQQSFEAALGSAMSNLPERERLIMALYYEEEMNLKEIGSILGVSESRVCQIQAQAAKRLRNSLSAWDDAAHF